LFRIRKEILVTKRVQMMQGLGNTQVWGLSPALDLQAESIFRFNLAYEEQDIKIIKGFPQMEQTLEEPFKILLAGSNDIRHILKTASRLKRHRHQKIKFYIIETQTTIIARHLLLLQTLFSDINDPTLNGIVLLKKIGRVCFLKFLEA
jgi:dynein assembly factor 3